MTPNELRTAADDRLLGYCPTSTTVTLVVALVGFIAGFLIVWRLLR